mmetsp:Transcript_12010/g.19610  ORF Transcript_12010/g.19610 Transcript_12010/m.19610 type:complete len:301 (-) Transcript_12010:68-970(-)
MPEMRSGDPLREDRIISQSTSSSSSCPSSCSPPCLRCATAPGRTVCLLPLPLSRVSASSSSSSDTESWRGLDEEARRSPLSSLLKIEFTATGVGGGGMCWIWAAKEPSRRFSRSRRHAASRSSTGSRCFPLEDSPSSNRSKLSKSSSSSSLSSERFFFIIFISNTSSGILEGPETAPSSFSSRRRRSTLAWRLELMLGSSSALLPPPPLPSSPSSPFLRSFAKGSSSSSPPPPPSPSPSPSPWISCSRTLLACWRMTRAFSSSATVSGSCFAMSATRLYPPSPLLLLNDDRFGCGLCLSP